MRPQGRDPRRPLQTAARRRAGIRDHVEPGFATAHRRPQAGMLLRLPVRRAGAGHPGRRRGDWLCALSLRPGHDRPGTDGRHNAGMGQCRRRGPIAAPDCPARGPGRRAGRRRAGHGKTIQRAGAGRAVQRAFSRHARPTGHCGHGAGVSHLAPGRLPQQERLLHDCVRAFYTRNRRRIHRPPGPRCGCRQRSGASPELAQFCGQQRVLPARQLAPG